MIVGIIGMTQGGTSAVASVVKALGYPIEGLDRTLDDAALFGPVEIPKDVIAARGNRWAWKYPIAYSEDLSFTDKFIVVWRDPIARAVHRRDLNAPNPTVLQESFELMESFMKVPGPVLHVSYEKLLVKTEDTVQVIADFLGVTYKHDAVLAVDAKKGYERTKEVNNKCYNSK